MSEQGTDFTFARFEPRQRGDEDDSGGAEFEIGAERFRCIPQHLIPAGALRRLSASVWTTEITCSFIESVLIDKDDSDDETPTQVERFQRVLDDKEHIVDNQLLSDIVVWVIGAVSAPRPTKSPSGSTGGRERNGRSSKAKRSGKASTSP